MIGAWTNQQTYSNLNEVLSIRAQESVRNALQRLIVSTSMKS